MLPPQKDTQAPCWTPKFSAALGWLLEITAGLKFAAMGNSNLAQLLNTTTLKPGLSDKGRSRMNPLDTYEALIFIIRLRICVSVVYSKIASRTFRAMRVIDVGVVFWAGREKKLGKTRSCKCIRFVSWVLLSRLRRSNVLKMRAGCFCELDMTIWEHQAVMMLVRKR